MSAFYEDILRLPHHRSAVHPPLSRQQRAAQFAPFAALTGYEAVVAEQARLTEKRAELDEGEQSELDRRLREAAEDGRSCRFTWFVADGRKEGGAYISHVGCIRHLDRASGLLELTDRTRIPLRELVAILPTDGL